MLTTKMTRESLKMGRLAVLWRENGVVGHRYWMKGKGYDDEEDRAMTSKQCPPHWTLFFNHHSSNNNHSNSNNCNP